MLQSERPLASLSGLLTALRSALRSESQWVRWAKTSDLRLELHLGPRWEHQSATLWERRWALPKGVRWASMSALLWVKPSE